MSKKKTMTEARIEVNEEVERERIATLAERMKLLIQFAFDLVPDIDLLERTAKMAGDRVSTTDAMAPILMAAGHDYDQIRMEKRLHARRADAMLNLIRVLQDTEKERAEFNAKQGRNAAARAELGKILGL